MSMGARFKSIALGAGGFLLCLLAWLAYQDHQLANDIRKARQQQLAEIAAQAQQYLASHPAPSK
jgi:hypothetical protein